MWSLLVVDQAPAIFWITNPNNCLLNNVAAGSAAYGYWFRPLLNPGGASTRTDICPSKTQLAQFDDNVTKATTRATA